MSLLPTTLLALGLSVLTATMALASQDGPLPRLAGTVIGPTAREALISVGRQQQSVASGDALGIWVVQAIEAGHVVLLGPNGPVDLWLAANPPRDEMSAAEHTLDWSNPCGRVHGAGSRHNVLSCRGARATAGLR